MDDDDVPVIRVATDTGGVDTGHTAPAPRADMTIGGKNNPTDTHGAMPAGPDGDTHVTNSDITIGGTNNPNVTHGAMPTGPSDDTHVANYNTAASPTLEQPNNDTHGINSDAAASHTLKETTTSAIGTAPLLATPIAKPLQCGRP